MEQSNLLRGRCPRCGEALEIPAHLQQFSCMYCGERLTKQDLLSKEKSEEEVVAAAYYRAHILETIIDHIGIEQEMTASRYPAAFERYTQANKETFRQLELAVTGGVMTLEEAASFFLDQLELRWDQEVKKHKSRSAVLENDKFIIAVYLVPMVRHLKLTTSEDFCQLLQAKWVARHPKSPFYLGTYESLTGGFQKKFLGLCYITTAICQQDGKPDDCPELTAFRTFRDGYLRSCPDGPCLIEEYYDIAPGIVLRIELSADPAATYAHIRDEYLLPCYRDIQSGNLKQCKDRYTAMVRNLKQEYLS